MSLENEVIVIDNGTTMIKAGFAGDDAPRAAFPCIVKRPRHQTVMVGMTQKDAYIGDEADDRYGILKEHFPMKGGIIVNWDDMEKIWHHTFYNELRIQPEEHSVVLTEIALNPNANREKTAEIMFEVFNIPNLFIQSGSALALHAMGKHTGIVLNSGGTITEIVPIYQGNAIQNNVCMIPFGGRNVTDHLLQLLTWRGYSFTTRGEREIIRDIKEKMIYVELNYENTLAMDEICYGIEKNYELPDGQVICIGMETYQTSEILFKPYMLQKKYDGFTDGIHKLLFDCMMKSDVPILDLCDNIVLCGGNTMFPNFCMRIENEVQKLLRTNINLKVLFDGYMRQCQSIYNNCLPNEIMEMIYRHIPQYKCNVSAPDHRKYLPWLGGSMFASKSEFIDLCIDKGSYEEYGKRIVHKR
eukprot:86749_1